MLLKRVLESMEASADAGEAEVAALEAERGWLEDSAADDVRILALEHRLALAEDSEAPGIRERLVLERDAQARRRLEGIKKILRANRKALAVFLIRMRFKARRIANGMRLYNRDDYVRSGHSASLPFEDLARVGRAAADAHNKLSRAAGNPARIADDQVADARTAVEAYRRMTDFHMVGRKATPRVAGGELHKNIVIAHKLAGAFAKMYANGFKWQQRLLAAAAKLYLMAGGRKGADAAKRVSDTIGQFKRMCRNAANQLHDWINFQMMAVEAKAGKTR